MTIKAGACGPVVTFGKDESLLAVPVDCVQEILDRQDMSWVPGSPAHVLGLLDVRGTMVPVVDLRSLLGEPPRPDGIDTRILVLRLERDGESVAVALRVDRVIEVTSLDEDAAGPPVRHLQARGGPGLLAGVGRRNGRFVSILAAAQLFDPALLKEAPKSGLQLASQKQELSNGMQSSLDEHARENA